MGFYEHLTEFGGKPVRNYDRAEGIADPAGTLYRLTVGYDEAWEEPRAKSGGWLRRIFTREPAPEPEPADPEEAWMARLKALLEDPCVRQLTGLGVGLWGVGQNGEGCAPIVEALVGVADRLPGLRSLFLGDITAEEYEVSWIEQSDVTPLLHAYPRLEHFGVRGGSLSLSPVAHESLKTLVVQTGGLPVEVVRAICQSDFPALEHLELWLGDEGYGADVTVADLEPILSGRLFPNLRYLGLKNSEIQDEIAAAVADAPITRRIHVLDLSMGTLGDEGAAALLDSPAIAKLEKLDLQHHYMSDEMVGRLQGLGIQVDSSDAQKPSKYDDKSYRYVAVGE